MQDLDTVALVKKRLQIATDDTKIKFQLWNQIDLIYNGSGKQQTTNAQIHNPYSWSNVETITPRMVARKPSVTYEPRIPGDPEEEQRAKNLQALFDYWWDRDRAFSKVVTWVKDSLIYGTGIVKVYWKTEVEDVKSYVYDQNGFPKTRKGSKKFEETVEKVTTYDDPCLENVDPYNFFVDPNATEIQEASWVLHRYVKSVDELEELGFDNVSELKAKIVSAKQQPSTEDNRRHQAAFGRYYTQDDTVDNVTCVEMWDGEGYKVIAVNAGIVLKDSENPFWDGKVPFIKLNDSLVPHEFYGKGEIEPVIKLQYALDTIQNQIIDYKTQILNPMWKVKGNVDESELVYRPNGVIHTDDFGDAEAHQPQDITRTGTEEKTALKEDIQQALGITDYTKGGESNVNKTATGVGLVQEAANARFSHKIQLLEEAVKELGDFVRSRYQQFITDEKQIAVMGPDGTKQPVRLLPQQVAGNFQTDVEAGSTQPVDKNKERQDSLTLFQLFAPAATPQVMLELEKHVLSNFQGTQDLERAIEQSAEQRLQQQSAPDPRLQQQQAQHEQQMELKMVEVQAKMQMEKMKAAAQPGTPADPHPMQKISESLNYKDALPSIQRQIEAAAGFRPANPDEVAQMEAKQAAEAAAKAKAPVGAKK